MMKSFGKGLFARSFFGMISNPLLSRLYGHLTRISRPRFFAGFLIRLFARHYRISMDDYQGSMSDYASLSEFFTRPLDPSARPLLPNSRAVLSPADGVLSHVEEITSDEAIQIKGKTYSLCELVGKNQARQEYDWSEGWQLAVIYLSPSNYHRFHYPLDGKLSWMQHLGNRLFPVNSLGLSFIENLFVRNERVVSCFDTNGQNWYLVAVGAAFVGGIHMNCHPLPMVSGEKYAIETAVDQVREMGHFAMGSTLVLLLPKTLASSCLLSPGTTVQVGDPIFTLGKV